MEFEWIKSALRRTSGMIPELYNSGIPEPLRANETRSKWTRSIFSVPRRRVSVGRVPMRRVPNRRGYIVMADTFTWFIKYCCIIDVFMRNERCAF